MPKLLTRRKEAWVGKVKPKLIRGLPLNPNAANEARYYAAMRKMVLQMSSQVTSELKMLFKEDHAKEYFAQDATISSQARILMNALIARFTQVFNLGAKVIAPVMVGQVDDSSAAALKASLKQLSGGLTLETDILTGELNDILSATVTENVALIRSIGSEYLTQVQAAVMRSITTGNGLQDLVPFLKQHEGISLRRARIIARDQTRKAFSNINFARMDKIGVKEYEWLHSAGGQKPRPLHIRMSGNVYRIDKPPIIDEKTDQRGKPGDLINCRCRAIPIIKFDDLG